MWPKALSSLIELLPHITRLVPMADRFFASKTAEQEANARAMQQMVDGLHGDLGQVTASHAGLYRQLNDQSEKVSELAADLRSTKIGLDALDASVNLLDKRLGVIRALVLTNLITVLAVMALVLAHRR